MTLAQEVTVSGNQTLTSAGNPYEGIAVVSGGHLQGNGLAIEQSSNNTGLLITQGSADLDGGSITQGSITFVVTGVKVVDGTATLTDTQMDIDGIAGSSALFVGGGGAASGVTGSGLNVEMNATGGSFGSPSAAVYATDGTADVSDSTFIVSGTNVYGLHAAGSNGQHPEIYSTNNAISTSGESGIGAFAFSAYDGSGTGVIHIDGGSIDTKGLYGYGLLSQEKGSEIHVTNGLSISTSGVWAIGAYAAWGGQIDLADATIETSGTFGVAAYSYNGAHIEIVDSRLETSGAGASGVVVYAAGNAPAGYTKATAAVSGTNIVTLGAGAHGLVATNGEIEAEDSDVDAAGWAAMADGGTNSFILTGTTMIGAEGLLNVVDTSDTSFSADASTLTGRILTGAGSTSDVDLTGGTLWTMNDDSNVTNLSNVASTILFAPTGDGTFRTLTVHEDYIGSDGTLVLNSFLGADGSRSDLLHVIGDTSGSTNMIVHNAGGPGAQTTGDGIMVVQVDGASAGQFVLSNSAAQGGYDLNGQRFVAAGAFGYALYQGGMVDPTDGDWYMRSAFGPDDSTLVYAPSVPVYEIYPQVLQSLNSLPTLQQRVGDRHLPRPARDDGQAGNNGDAASSATAETYAIWTRIEGSHEQIEPAVSTTRADYDIDSWTAQIGVEGQFLENDAGKLVGGLTAHYGEARATVDSLFGTSRIDASGYGVGATLTWYGMNGVYVDGQAQASWYDSDLSSDKFGGHLADGNNGSGYALSLEAGKRFQVSPGLALVPQAQLIYSRVDFDNFNDPFGARVSLEKDASLEGRLGLSAEHQRIWKDDQGHVSRSNVYAIANIYNDFSSATEVSVFGGGGDGVVVKSREERVSGGIGVGGAFDWADGTYSLYGEGTVATSLSNFGDSYEFYGTAGFRVRW